MLTFNTKEKKSEDDLKIILCGKRLYPPKLTNTRESKLMQILLDNVKLIIPIKQNRTNALLFKIRKYDSRKILRSTVFLFVNYTYFTALSSELRILELFNGL